MCKLGTEIPIRRDSSALKAVAPCRRQVATSPRASEDASAALPAAAKRCNAAGASTAVVLLPNSSRRTAASGSGDQPVRSEAGSTALPKPCEASLGCVTAAPEPAVPDAGSDRRLALKPGKWNLRAGPGTAYPSLGTVSDAVTEVDAGGWVCVRVGDRHGWVSLNAVAAPPERT